MELLKIEEVPYNVIVKDAEEAYPYECCGFMYGKEVNGRVVTKAIPVENVKTENRERRFEISPLEYMKAERYADENNLLLLGVYHSHPDHPAIASEHDLKQAVPFFSYVIAAVKQAKVVDVKSWRLDDQGAFQEEQVAKLIFEICKLKSQS